PVVYELSVSGPDHDRHYVAQVRMGERVLGAGEGRSKKSAEIEAARAAWEVVQGA
ncbi:MAG: ribonuclease III, partial [Actinobacteria bacterium]|nr:ribonuclease III [Actinomycetota bacterium]